jgi:Peptidase_C39 like family
MDVMQTGLRSTHLVPTPTQAYPQFDGLNNQEVAVYPMQNYTFAISVQPETPSKKSRPSFFSTHLRILVSLGFLLMVGVSLLGTSGVAGGTLQHLIQGIGLFTHAQPITNQNISLTSHSTFTTNASQQLARISQLDPNQYASTAEYNTWAYSACSTASMTEVFDSYGYHFRITDVLSVESQIGAITPDQGLVDPSGIASTAAKFGFKTQWGNGGSLDQVIATANSGKPVIVGFPPDRYEGGHLLVVIGGDSDNVFLADTSLWNRHVVSRAQFLAWWGGFYAVVTPK